MQRIFDLILTLFLFSILKLPSFGGLPQKEEKEKKRRKGGKKPQNKSKYNEIEEMISPGFRRGCGRRGLASCGGSIAAALAQPRRRAPAVPARLSGPATPRPLSASRDVLPGRAGMAESRWGNQPARGSDGTAQLPRGSSGSAAPAPAPQRFRGALGALGAPARLDTMAACAGLHGPPDGRPETQRHPQVTEGTFS